MAWAAHVNGTTGRNRRKMYSRLSRRVASAHDEDLFACASWCLARGGAVENANSPETLEARDVQAAAGPTRFDDHCPAFHLRTVRKGSDEPHPVSDHSGSFLGDNH